PLFGSETPVPKAAKKHPNVLQKIEGALTRQGAELMIGSPGPPKGNSNAVEVPQRVMIGGADSMENLLPKSP
ncbi:MAG TPA: hypothetical protein VJM50_20580, partial [Pyrinomonadaceae bacterium]|nr:hypothetical protein [Pyrinomonadaceae bacterium]